MKSVILDTDIGCDIDDTWALCHLLNSPELALKLVTTVSGNPVYRATIVAKIFRELNLTHIPIGMGLPTAMLPEQETLRPWIRDFRLADYRGTVEPNGIQLLAQTLQNTANPTLICIGPLNNVAAIAKQYPELCRKTDFIAMAGSLRRQLNRLPGKIPEWNVRTQIKAAQTAFAAPWKSATITPLDTCGNVFLAGENFRRIKQSEARTAQLVCQSYTTWRNHNPAYAQQDHASSILFDTVAVFLAYSHDFLNLRPMFLHVDDRGMLQVNTPQGRPFTVALDWTDLQTYKDHLTRRILSTYADRNLSC